MNNNSEIILLTGAGFSFSAGLPLTKDLFAEIPASPFKNNKALFEQVKLSWKKIGKKVYSLLYSKIGYFIGNKNLSLIVY